MVNNADLSYGDLTWSIGRSCRKRGDQIQVMTENNRSLAEGLARDQNQ